MGRAFSFEYEGRTLTIRPIAVDEGWELWVMDGEKRLTCGGLISVDEAVSAGRQGHDRIRLVADQIRERIMATGFQPPVSVLDAV
jgi:hypothetical protein